jgi:hypothetical protein
MKKITINKIKRCQKQPEIMIFYKSYSIILFCCCSLWQWRKVTLGDDTDDATSRPIDDYIPVLMLVGFTFAYRFTKKQGL